jgi:hypothetical protein
MGEWVGISCSLRVKLKLAGATVKCNARTRICKRLWSPEIDSEESIQLAYVAWRAGTTNRVVVPARQAGNRFLDSIKGLQIRAQAKAAAPVSSKQGCESRRQTISSISRPTFREI